MRISILALTPVARDARVLRSAAALAGAGHEVVVIGREPLPPTKAFQCVGIAPVPSAGVQRLELVATQAPATLWPAIAHPLYWLPAVRRQLLARALETCPDVVFSNDWLTLPVGTALQQRLGATLVYDSHEYATKEHIQNWKWRIVSRAAVSALERRNVARADLVITVSRGIAEALQADYRLPVAPTVVRNLPPYLELPYRAPNDRRRVLFHGLIRPERGLESLIDSMPHWTFDGELVIRGYGLPAYIEGLRGRARQRRVAERISFEPPVDPQELIRQASTADIGYLALPGTTDHYEYALPNKLFEYLMAGLPVLASPRREIRTLLQQSGAGVLAEPEPERLAEVLNAVGRDDVARMRRAALAAAAHLNWDAEQSILVKGIEEAYRRRLARVRH